MAIQQEIWLRDIQGNLFPDNAFYMNSIDDTPFVINGKTVHIPQAGAKPNVEKNRSVLPAVIDKRTDTIADYDLDEFTTDPILLQNTEEIEISYAKRQNILAEHQATLDEEIADNFAYLWTPSGASNIVRTTGTTRDTKSPGATGTRKGIAKADIISAQEILNRMNVPQEGRHMLIPAEMLSDILSIDQFVNANTMGSQNITKGAIGMLFGIMIHVRSKVTIFDNTGTPVAKAPGAATAATDNASALIWSDRYVSRARGQVKVFINPDKAEYYGDVFSALVRAGGRKRRTDQKGVVSIVETLVS